MSGAGVPLTRRFPAVLRLLADVHQDFDLVPAGMATLARAAARTGDARVIAAELRAVAALPAPDLKAFWRRSRADVVPVRVEDMRRMLNEAASALDGGA